jgi:putative transposase
MQACLSIGSLTRTLTTTAGDLELRIPKLRTGSFFPSLLERRRRIDQALFAVVMEAYLHGVSTRKVDDLVRALGADTGISTSKVSRICADLKEEVGAFRDRSLAETAFPYVFLDATYCKARVDRRVVSEAVVIATGVAADGHREVLGCAVGDSEDGASLDRVPALTEGPRPGRGAAGHLRRAHRPKGRHRVGPAQLGLAAGALPAQRARPRAQGQRRDVAAAIRTIFAQPDAEHVHSQLDVIAGMLGGQFPQAEGMLREDEDDLLAFTAFPVGHAEVDLVDQSAGAAEQGDQAAHQRRRRDSQPPKPCSASPARSWLRPTTSGRFPTAATSPKAPWPYSTDPSPTRRWRSRP